MSASLLFSSLPALLDSNMNTSVSLSLRTRMYLTSSSLTLEKYFLMTVPTESMSYCHDDMLIHPVKQDDFLLSCIDQSVRSFLVKSPWQWGFRVAESEGVCEYKYKYISESGLVLRDLFQSDHPKTFLGFVDSSSSLLLQRHRWIWEKQKRKSLQKSRKISGQEKSRAQSSWKRK